MKRSALLLTPALAGLLLLSACSDSEKRADATAGDVVTDIDEAKAEGGASSDAVVIDNNAGPAVTADADTARQMTGDSVR